MTEPAPKFMVINFHYEGGGICATFDTEDALDEWLKDKRPSAISQERWVVVKGVVLREIGK